MKADMSLRRLEPLDAVRRHPLASAIGGVVTAIVCGGMAAVASSPIVAAVMALCGLAIGAPGGAHIAESADRTESIRG